MSISLKRQTRAATNAIVAAHGRGHALGTLTYGDSKLGIEFDDRLLAHLQIVISAKLRRQEGFFLNWADDPAGSKGRSSVWLQHTIPLYFRYSSSRRPEINKEWLEQLTLSANRPQGLHLVPEPGAEGTAGRGQLRLV